MTWRAGVTTVCQRTDGGRGWEYRGLGTSTTGIVVVPFELDRSWTGVGPLGPPPVHNKYLLPQALSLVLDPPRGY